MAQQKRSPPEIIAQILEATIQHKRKTQIMYDVRVDFRTLEKYLEYLLTKGLLEKNGANYRATEKGKQFVEKYKDTQKILES